MRRGGDGKGRKKRKIEGKDEEGRIWEGEIEEEDRRGVNCLFTLTAKSTIF